MSRSIAFFDFDGTITSKDTLLEFIKFSSGKFRFYKGFMLHIHYLIGYKIKLISNQHAKEKILAYFFGDMSFSTFQNICNRFAEEVIPSLIRSKAFDEISQLQTKNTEIVIVSASPGHWITPWADRLGIKVIATRLEVKEDRLTGKIEGLNCYGIEKVKRIKEQYNLSVYERVYAYGDTRGDKPMLAIAHDGFMKPFH